MAQYRPPWYPVDLPNPWTFINTMSNAQETNYSRWCKSLPPGELQRLIREHRRRIECAE